MNLSKRLLQLLSVIAGLLLPAVSLAQGSTISMMDSTGLHSYSVVSGDTVLIGYDSAYVLNKRTFKLFKDNYIKVQNGNPATKLLITQYESLISMQDSMLKAKEAYYQGLKSNFDDFTAHTNVFVDRTDANITSIDKSLAAATGQLNNIKSLLDDSLDKLKKESRQKLKMAVAGFSVGVVLTSVIFLVTK